VLTAPAHRTRETIELLRRETTDFISPEQWPPNSPDLNPVDYKLWAIMQQRVYQTKIRKIRRFHISDLTFLRNKHGWMDG